MTKARSCSRRSRAPDSSRFASFMASAPCCSMSRAAVWCIHASGIIGGEHGARKRGGSRRRRLCSASLSYYHGFRGNDAGCSSLTWRHQASSAASAISIRMLAARRRRYRYAWAAARWSFQITAIPSRVSKSSAMVSATRRIERLHGVMGTQGARTTPRRHDPCQG
jgi:hypothetical protein